jgi:hypothetical protein
LIEDNAKGFRNSLVEQEKGAKKMKNEKWKFSMMKSR